MQGWGPEPRGTRGSQHSSFIQVFHKYLRKVYLVREEPLFLYSRKGNCSSKRPVKMIKIWSLPSKSLNSIEVTDTEATTYDPMRVGTKYSRCVEDRAIILRRKASLREVFANVVKSCLPMTFDNDICLFLRPVVS